jgi:predicted homoserine dehydrogenase-like protein
MAPREMGGIYGTRHVVDIPSVIGSINEPPYGGNVFVIVHCDNEHAMQMIKRKGVMVNSAGTTAALLRPYHLCGAETAMSVLCAGILGIPTGAARPLPYVDITCTTRRRFKAGEEIGPLLDSGWNQDLRAALVQGVRVRPGNPLPFFMLEGNRCKCDIPEGTLITCEMIELRPDSILWALRKEQDEYFAHMLAE